MTKTVPISLQARHDIQVQEIAILTRELRCAAVDQAKVVRLQRDLDMAHARITALQGSTSWKITRPLRAIVRLARSGRSPS